MIGKRNRRYFGAFSFTFIYCWYDSYGRHFEDSPVASSLGASLAFTVKTLVSLSVIAGVAASLLLPWQRLVEQKRPLKILAHLMVFLPFYLFPLFPYRAPAILLSLLGGFCMGAVVARSAYTMFFEIMDVHPAQATVIGYIIIQLYVHLSDIVPLVAVPALYYALSAATLLAGAVLSYLRLDGEDMERRRVLPENRFWIADNWHILVMILMIQSCITLYAIFMTATQWQGPFGEALNIIPDILTLLFLALLGKRLTLVGSMLTFLTLFTGAISSFILFGANARIPMQFFMEPAYRIVDFMFIWILAVVFYTYGHSQIRLKACLTVFFGARFAGVIAFEALFAAVPPTAEAAYFSLLPAFFTALLLPSAQRALKSMEGQRAYAEGQRGPNVPLPPEREDVLDSLEALMRTLPEGTALTEGERTALCYLIAGQGIEMAAHFMDIPARRVQELNGAILEKFSVKSVFELMVLLGAAQADSAGRKSREELFDRYGLTEREREIAALLLSAEAIKNIASTLGVSQSTVSFHSKNLYRKCDIQSRSELSTLFAGTAPEHQKILKET